MTRPPRFPFGRAAPGAPDGLPHVVVVGAGFAGHAAAKGLIRRLRGRARITVIDQQDHFVYLPLLPEVAVGTLEPRRIAVSLSRSLRGAEIVLGTVERIDVDTRTVAWRDPDGGHGQIRYDRLLLAAGSVNALLPIPGVAENAHGFRSIPEALYLRDHMVRQIEIAATIDDAAERRARLTFVTVGAGYTGTELAAQGAMLTALLARDRPALRGTPVRWILIDRASRVLPELDRRLSRTADRVLRRRGVEIRTGESVAEAAPGRVRLTSGEMIDTRTLVWCVGVRPDPLVADLGLPTDRGRLVVGTDLRVPGRPEIHGCGDASAVPDVTRGGTPTAMTAQHATRQGALAARNVAASLGYGEPGTYAHHDLGFVVELGGADAAANPLGVPLSGLAATVVTRGYHLLSMPGNRLRVATDWLLDAVTGRQAVQLGVIRAEHVPLETAEPHAPDGPATAADVEPVDRPGRTGSA
ncbi:MULTISPECIES: FAD-dependent oxidoreductase [unclassified Pseudonocardia]|uniref:NAD(P)/FAD-dependent oxidoreductase n=1 Tax=unclassified Pseudonocardia TaxID=2619320 RepID=UPI0001FFDB89|nr:FAD-dependent oxidoreductase [Pseudonocardia sp. Ae707_Ps1]OLM18876.1 NADH dehydrogenase [Pseudonocardia sp. Ae707_Ps1]